jgi:hypothetical protein
MPPRRTTMTRDTPFGFVMSAEERKMLQELADIECMTAATWIRRMIVFRYREREKRLAQRWGRD